MTPARDMVTGWLERLGFDPGRYAVFDLWDRLLGAEAGKARAVGLKGRKLYVETDTPARRHDLTLRKPGLLRRLNAAFGTGGAVSDIIVRLASEDGERERA